jgi:hypothetical protein
MISSFSEIFVQYGTLLTTIVFCGFFSISLVALVFRDHEMVRQLYVVFLLCLVLGSSLTGLQPIPIVNAHEYSSVASEQYTHYDLRVVDTEGRELPYDPRAVRPAIQVEELAAIMAKGDVNTSQVSYTPSQRREMAAFLLRSAREYRRGLDAGQEPLAALVSALKFPPHHLRGHWTAKELSEFSRFVAIRVYRIEVTFAENGRRAVTGDETLVYEYRRGGNETT